MSLIHKRDGDPRLLMIELQSKLNSLDTGRLIFAFLHFSVIHQYIQTIWDSRHYSIAKENEFSK